MKRRHVPLSDIRITKKAKKYVLQALDSNRLSYGPLTQQFEKLFAKSHQRKYAMFINSGTSGLQVALHALKNLYQWDNGDEVLVPAVTFIASSNVVLHNHMQPVFVDVENDFYCINPKKIEEKITKKTRAIMPVHLFGQSADMEPIIKIAKKYNLKILEDSCEAMFVNYKGLPVGSMGDVSVYSTYIAHIITTGVGGIISTNDDEIALMMKSLMFHGRDNIYLNIDDDNTRDKVKINSLIERRFQFNHVGYSYRNTELEGALGLAEMEQKNYIIKKRISNGQKLTKKLSKFSEHFQLPEVRPNAEHIYMLYPIIIKNKKIDKNDFLSFLELHGVETRLFFPLLSQPVYKKIFGDIEHQYPTAKKLVENGFILGGNRYYTKNDLEYIFYLFQTYLKSVRLI